MFNEINYDVIKDRNYEKLLLNFLNKSSYFSKMGSLDFDFVKPQSETHGECDAIKFNKNKKVDYEIDFKLFMSTSHGRACRINTKTERYIPLYKYLQNLSVDDYLKINKKQIKIPLAWENYKNEIRFDLYVFVNKILLTNKNLLFFIPNEIDADSSTYVIDYLNDHFLKMFEYREIKVGNYETYFSFVMNCDKKEFIITRYNKNTKRLEFIESMPFDELSNAKLKR